MKRRSFLTLLGGAAAAWPLGASAQQREPMRRLGVLTAGANFDPIVQSMLREELAKLGWIEGRNLNIDFRGSVADLDRIDADAAKLVNVRPDVIFAFTGAAARAAERHTQIIPIVFVGGGDPLESKLVDGVARPTGNATGFANNFNSLGGKWLGLLKAASPHITRVAHMFDANLSANNVLRATIDAAAAQLSIMITRMPVGNRDEIAPAIHAFAATTNGGLLLTGPHSAANVEAIMQLALRHRLPAMFGSAKLVAEGLLMSNGPDVGDLVRRASSYVDRILRGVKPSDLPIQYPTKFDLVINLKTAKAIGLEIPPTLLALAEEVIE